MLSSRFGAHSKPIDTTASTKAAELLTHNLMGGGILLALLSVLLLTIVYKINLHDEYVSHPQSVQSMYAILCFGVLVVCICGTFVPGLRDLALHSSLSAVLLFTVFVLVALVTLSPSWLSTNGYWITPVLWIVFGYLQYQAASTTSTSANKKTANDQSPRLHIVLQLFCLVTMVGMFYWIDPGDIFRTYVIGTGSASVLTVVILALSVVYAIALFLVPQRIAKEKDKQRATIPWQLQPQQLQQPAAIVPVVFSKESKVLSVVFAVCAIGISVIIATYPGGFFSAPNRSMASTTLVLLFLMAVLWMYMFSLQQFPDWSTASPGDESIVIRGFTFLVGVVLALLVAVWIGMRLSQPTSISVLLGNGVLIGIAGIAMYTYYFSSPTVSVTPYQMLGIALIGMLVLYGVNKWFRPTAETDPTTEDTVRSSGTLLVGPIYLNKPTVIGSLAFSYYYTLSCDVFLDASPVLSPGWKTVLSWGNKPCIEYNAEHNRIRIRMNEKVLYTHAPVSLQVWTTWRIRYSGGTVDVFQDGTVVQSTPGMVPYHTMEALTVGDEELRGGIRNVTHTPGTESTVEK